MTYQVVPSDITTIAELADIQRICFPGIPERELISAQHFSKHIETFPEGQASVKSQDGAVVASASTFVTQFDFNNIEHRYIEKTGNNTFETHDPLGGWLYLADIGVHPDHRKRGLSRRLIEHLRTMIKRRNLKGMIGGGLLKGFHKHKAAMTPDAYVERVINGKLFDPSLSTHIALGFEVQGVIEHYVEDASCANKAALIVWKNPGYASDSASTQSGFR